jgi:hypothetical protein
MRRVLEPLSYQLCKERAWRALSWHRPKMASSVAEAIWPKTPWKSAEGAGGAASRVLKQMEKEGLVRWGCDPARKMWGYLRA